MKLYRTGSAINSQPFICYAHQETRVDNAWGWGDDRNKARVHFNGIGKGTERFSDFAIVIDYKDVLNILNHVRDPMAQVLSEDAYFRGHYLPRYPMPSKISHWCNVLMTEVRKGGVI